MSEKLNLHQKLVEVRKSIDGFTKDAKSFNYSYVSGSQVLSKIQAKMNELGVLLVPKIADQTFQTYDYQVYDKKSDSMKDKTDFIVHGTMSYTWKNADDPSDTLEVPFYYTGQQDDISKAFGSGLTYSERYFLLKFFNLPTDDADPDAKDTSGRSSNRKSYKNQGSQKGSLSDAQVNRLFAIGNSVGVNAAGIKKVLMADYNKTEVKQLTKKEYDEVCNRLESKKGA
jgi:hypothetical protein